MDEILSFSFFSEFLRENQRKFLCKKQSHAKYKITTEFPKKIVHLQIPNKKKKVLKKRLKTYHANSKFKLNLEICWDSTHTN